MRITIDDEYGMFCLRLVDTDGDGIISIEFTDDNTGAIINTMDTFGNELNTVYDKQELKTYLKLVLEYMEKSEEME